jgi:dephospho-CoA kinase
VSICIGLTGGIAAGKTTVADRFARRGVPIIDADIVARELVAPGQPALAQIVAAFGPAVLAADGGLDRRAMRARIFADAAARGRLEAILHPRVRAQLRGRALASHAPYVLLAIPLLAESAHAYDWLDRVLVVDVPRAVQLERLMQRDGMTADYAEQALAAQATRAQRLALADDVIDNSAAPATLDEAIEKLHAIYSLRADARPTARP